MHVIGLMALFTWQSTCNSKKYRCAVIRQLNGKLEVTDCTAVYVCIRVHKTMTCSWTKRCCFLFVSVYMFIRINKPHQMVDNETTFE